MSPQEYQDYSRVLRAVSILACRPHGFPTPKFHRSYIKPFKLLPVEMKALCNFNGYIMGLYDGYGFIQSDWADCKVGLTASDIWSLMAGGVRLYDRYGVFKSLLSLNERSCDYACQG